MERQKRPFYIIGHNPNTIEEAQEYLDKGANALEPDILHVDGIFYVCHHALPSYEGIPTVEEYLQALESLVRRREYDLSLLIFDMKETDFDVNDFIGIVQANLSPDFFKRITILITHGDAHNFVNRYDGRYDNIGVGVDESNVPPAELEQIFKGGGQKNFSYADGITTFLAKPGVYGNITAAQACNDQNAPASFGFIYTWVLSHKASMRRYLDTYIDGIMVDPGAVSDLRKLVTAPPYDEVYRLATNGDNPFKQSQSPRYRLEISTSKKFLSGTDATILFTLTGRDNRSVQSLPFNGKEWGALERGSVTNVWLEGINIGEIETLTVEALTDGAGSAWLPERITVASKLLDAPVTFTFNESDEEWISKKAGAIVKYPV